MQRKKAVDQVQMLREIELLKEQVHELRMMVFNGTDITKTKTVTDGETKLSTKKEQKQPIKLDEEKLLQSSEKERSWLGSTHDATQHYLSLGVDSLFFYYVQLMRIK